jgi:hypothetical protein
VRSIYALNSDISLFLFVIFRYLILGKKEKIPLKLFVDVCLWLGIEMDMDQMECILVNLIYKRYIKGYLSHSVGFIVLSDKNPFPSFKNEANTIQ